MLSASERITVITTVKPAASIIQNIIGDAAEVKTLLPEYASPHNYKLKPSDIRILSKADLVIWVGSPLERYLEKVVEKLPAEKVLDLSKIPGLMKTYEELDDQIKIAQAKMADHHDDEHDHEGENHGHDEDGHGHEDAHDHSEGSLDPHFWLSPGQTAFAVDGIAEFIGTRYPEYKTALKTNSDKLKNRLEELHEEVAGMPGMDQNIPFIVFHDGYSYLVAEFQLNQVGAVSLHPEILPGIAALTELRNLIRKHEGQICLMDEPQYSNKIIQTVGEGFKTGNGTFDPLGIDIPSGPDMYFNLTRKNMKSLSDCLKASVAP